MNHEEKKVMEIEQTKDDVNKRCYPKNMGLVKMENQKNVKAIERI